jgi:hypothetical protein
MLGGGDMPMEQEPVIGAMYEDEDGLAFEVLSFDEDEGIIEMQYEDGEVSEIDIDTWYELDLKQLKSVSPKDDEDQANDVEVDKAATRAPDPKEDNDIDDFDDVDNDEDDRY